jgi:hypothetical protein
MRVPRQVRRSKISDSVHHRSDVARGEERRNSFAERDIRGLSQGAPARFYQGGRPVG